MRPASIGAGSPGLDSARVPQLLRDLPQWLVWRYEQRAGDKKPRKMPYYANGRRRRGEQGSAADLEQLVSFAAAADVAARGGHAGVGFAFLPGDGLIGVDLDNVIDADTGEVAERAVEIVDLLGSYTELSPSRRGLHIFVKGTVDRSFKSNEIGVEVFCGAQFFTFTGEHYAGTPGTIETPPKGALLHIQKMVDRAKAGGAPNIGAAGNQPKPPPAGGAAAPPISSSARSKVESALAVLSPDCGYDEWLRIGMAIQAELGTAGLDVWDSWSAKGAKYPGRATLETHWRSFDGAGGITAATLYKMARDAGWRAPRAPRPRNVRERGHDRAQSPAAGETDEALPEGYSEDVIARRFTERHGANWRYVAVWGRWLFWDGRRWRDDLTLKHFDLARRVCRDAAAAARADPNIKNGERLAMLIQSARTVAAVVKLAAADRAHAEEVDVWDSDPWLLNTPGGLVDLRTGRMAPHRRDAYCTKITAATPGGKCRAWFAFLHRITGGDKRLIAYLQRLVGYALTGSTREHVLAFLYGLGANGKSTFLNTVSGLLGDYAQGASMDTFTESHGDRHPTDLAMLRGARLVVGQEVDEGQRWAAARIKSLTGGDAITARFMRQDFFSFVPQFTLVLAGNHKPALRNVDEAMRRRLHLVPFLQVIPVRERDQHLSEKLRAEAGGILAWAIRGCLRWQRLGLRPPAVVRDATDAYLADEDVLEAWMSECVESSALAFTGTKDLHRSYQAWAERSREKFYGLKRFGQLLEERGYARERTARANGFRGLRLLPVAGQPNQPELIE